jgi:AcrR family transcriptional regulator
MSKNDLIRRHFAGVLMDVCEARRLDEVTVVEVVEAAGVARQTFYNHFSDINDLICYTASLPILSNPNAAYTDLDNLARMFDTARAHRGFFSQLPRQTGQNSFRTAYNEWIKRQWYRMALTDDLTEEERAYRKARIAVYAEGTTAMLMEFFSSDMSTPNEVYLRAVERSRPTFMRETHVPRGIPAEYPR